MLDMFAGPVVSELKNFFARIGRDYYFKIFILYVFFVAACIFVVGASHFAFVFRLDEKFFVGSVFGGEYNVGLGSGPLVRKIRDCLISLKFFDVSFVDYVFEIGDKILYIVSFCFAFYVAVAKKAFSSIMSFTGRATIVLSFLIVVLLCLNLYYIVFSTAASLREDDIYRNSMGKKSWSLRNDDVSVSSPESLMIVEPTFNENAEVKKFARYVGESGIKNVFISRQVLVWLQGRGLLDVFIEALSDVKTRLGVKVFCDIELCFDDVEFPKQLMLGASWDGNVVYNKARDFASHVRSKFKVDYIIGPVLDRKMSYADTTVSHRSYGVDLKWIYVNACLTVLGFNSSGVGCVPKHFPGHPQSEIKNMNPHYRTALTAYSEEMLKRNSLPFQGVLQNPFTRQRFVLTDHVVIPYISQDVPYSVYYESNPVRRGVDEAFARFLGAADGDYLIKISDDVGMILPDNLKQMLKSGVDCDVAALAPHIVTMLRAGHDMVLIRGIKISRFVELANHVRGRVNELPSDDLKGVEKSLRKVASASIESSYAYVPNVTDAKSCNDGLKILDIGGNRLGTSSVTLQQMRRKNILYISICSEYDDFESVFLSGAVSESKNKKFILKTYDTKKFSFDVTRVASDIQNVIDIKNFDYIVVVVSDALIKPALSALVQKVFSANRAERLFVFLADSPDILYRALDSQDVFRVLANSNVYCVYSNTQLSAKIFSESLSRKRFDEMPGIKNLTIDMQDYYYYDNIGKDVCIDQRLSKMVYGSLVASSHANNKIVLHICIFSVTLCVMAVIVAIFRWFHVKFGSIRPVSSSDK